MKKIISASALLIMGVAVSNGANYYFSQGVQGEASYNRNWSDLNNWSTVEVSTSTSDVGNVWNTNVATETVTGVGTNIYLGYGSAKLGTTVPALGTRYLNLDVKDIVISSLQFQDRSNVADHVKGEDLTFETANGSGTIVTKSRNYGASYVSNNIILNTTSAGAISYKISNTTTQDLIFNGDFSINGTMNSGSWEPLTVYCQSSTGTSARGNVIFNGAMNFNRCLVVEKSGTNPNITSKVYLQGTGNNTMTLKVRNNAIAVLNKDADYLAAGAYEIYAGGVVEVMSSTQVSSANNIKSVGVFSSSDTVSGTMLMHGNNVSVGTITISAASSVAANAGITQLFKFDFGTEMMGNGRELSFSKLTVDASGKLDLSTSGLLIVNYDELNDKIFTTNTADSAADYADLIFFEGFGEKGVDYDVLASRGENNYWYYTITSVPEPATLAAIFGALAMAFAVVHRRK